MPKKIKRLNLLKGYKVVIKSHVVDQYMERAGVTENEARATLEAKFRNSVLVRFKPDGSEHRSEIGGSKAKRCTFVARKEGRTFVVITCYLQGPRDNWWKNEGLVKEQPESDFGEIKEQITKEMEESFQEVLR